jgi:ribosomal protein S18 acetylase RimI-like enzyme
MNANLFQVSEIKDSSDIPRFPPGLSFFDPYIEYHIREVLGVGGEAYVARDPDRVLGVFIYDDYEKTGTLYSQSIEAFNYFRELKPSSFLFAEVQANLTREVFDIYSLKLEDPLPFHFKYELDSPKLDEIEHFMLDTHPNVNPSWCRVALLNGDKCFVVRFKDKCVGCAWVSLTKGVGRLHTLYVKSRYRRMGIGEDLLYARLLWLKLKTARLAFSEISENNIASTSLARKANMHSTGHVYLYS